MADNDTSLEVLIKSVLDATGYRMNEAEAAKLKATISQIGTASAVANEEDAAGTEKLTLKKRELMHIVNALGGKAVPELSRALATLAYGGGTVAAIFALVGVFEMVSHAIEAARAKAEEAAAGAWTAQRDAIQAAASAAQDFADRLDAAKSNTDKLKVSLDLEKAVLDAQIDSHKKLLDAIEKQQMAEAAGDKVREAAIKKRFEDLKAEYDMVAESLKLEQLRDDITNRQISAPKRKAAALQAESDIEEEQLNPDAAKAAATIARLGGKDALPKLKQAADAAQKVVDSFSPEQLERFQNVANDLTQPEGVRLGAQSELSRHAAATKDVADFNSLDSALAVQRQHDEALKRLGEKLKRAEEARDNNTKAIEDETNQLTSGEAVLNEHRASQRRQHDLEQINKAGGLDNSGGIIGGGVAALDALQHGQRLNAIQSEQLATYRALFDLVGGNVVAMVNIARQALAHGVSQQQEIAALRTDFENLRSRSGTPKQ